MTVIARPVLTDLDRRLSTSSLGSSLRRDHSLASFTTYRVGGPARLFVTVDDRAGLEALATIVSTTAASQTPPPLLVVGRGSNLLVADRGFDGLAVALGPGLARTETAGAIVTAGGAALLPVVARTTADAGLRGFEWAVGVPGTLGGAVRMNAGGHGADMAASLTDVVIVDLIRGATRTRAAADLRLGYRTSSIGPHQVVASARLRLRAGDATEARAEVSEIVRWRRANQPGGRNAGSVFTNPQQASAGSLVESAGAKGMRIGSAQVSTKHANFIQSDEGGSAADIVTVMREVRRRVQAAHGIDLCVETHLVGFEPEDLP